MSRRPGPAVPMRSRTNRPPVWSEAWRRFPVQEMTVDLMVAAFETRRRFGISYWDAAIIEAGRALGCGVVLSEDLDPAPTSTASVCTNPFR